jgi:hypothetical protein
MSQNVITPVPKHGMYGLLWFHIYFKFILCEIKDPPIL